MWKRPEEITEHNQSKGSGEKFDPAQWLHTLVVEVETIWLEGDTVILAGCCESVRMRRDDVIGWRELPGRDGHPSTYQVRLRQGAEGIAQRAIKVTQDQPRCPRCGRGWDGLPPARGRDENSPDDRREGRGDREGCDRGHDDCHGREAHHHGHHGHHGGHGHHGHHGHHGGHGHHGPHHGEQGAHPHGEHGGGDHHYWHHAEGQQHHHHGGGEDHHHHDE